jgi:ABC-2 type transport system ATP-binding protein
VLDEPTAGVDPVSRRDFWQLLARLQQEGLSIVMSTAYLDEAERCGRVGFLHQGRLLADGDPQLLRGEFALPVLEILARPLEAARDALRALPQVASVETFGERLHAVLSVAGADTESDQGRITSALEERGITVTNCRSVPPSLEDVFISKIREEVH